jgi:signal peptidase
MNFRLSHRLPRALGIASVVALTSLAALVLLPALLGYQRYVIAGGSMGDALPRGSLAYDEEVPTGRLRVGDVITYRPPSRSHVVTHRIAWVGRDRRGRRVYRTRGDANPGPDPWTFSLPGRTQARVAIHFPLVGYGFVLLSVRTVRMVVIGLPALVIAAGAFRRAWRTARAPDGEAAAQNFG